ncbi:MAG: Ig-like domain repeat protein, partial [Candidatus Cloacimonas sp.]|nr:Ig-like domain repeat protein [Candidatus Cloacimonas sp.]
TLGNANILNTLDGVHYTATFEDINIMHNGMPDDGYYLFRLSVQDLAIPTPNVANITVATNVLYDVTLPNVAMTSINGVTDMLLPINIDLGTTATIEAAAYDALGGQTHQVASGIQKLEFYYNYNGTDVMISEDATAPYAAAWNTTGLPVGTYNVTVKALDNAGNEASVVKSVTIGSPTTWQPFAMVTAMNFDGDTANQDAIYTVVDTWANETINGVTFEYTSNGTTWTQFATATNMGAYWKAMFNAELMTTVTQIRTVVNYNDDLTSTNKPVLAVTYSALQGGSLVVTTPTIMPSVYYNNEVRVTGAVSAPRVTTMFEDSYVGMPQVQMVNGNQTAFFNVNAHGEYNFWAAAINYDTWMMQLNKATLNTHNIGTVASNGISTTVPANSFVYFETVMPTVALEDGFTALSLQNAVLASPQQDLTLTVTLNATPTTQGTIVGMYYDGAAWISVPATVNANNTVTFDAPSGYIYAVAQYTGVTVNTMFVSVDPQYVTPQTNAVWTLANTTAKFLVYTGMNQGGYETPMFGEFEYQMYLDNMLVIDNAAANYTDGIITYNATGLAAGLHTARVMVTMDGFNAFAEKQFNVEITEPVIVATGTQLNINNRTISATITDPQTGIADAYIAVTGWGSSMTIPMENLVVNGNVYSYSFTMDDLNALGYDVNYTEEMVATWHASNNLLLTTVSQPINYTVNIEGPAIAFTGFTNGWWLNPTFNTPLTFTVTVPTGRTIPVDGVMIDLQEVTAAGNNQIQYMTLAPVSVAGNVYSYSLNFGQMLSPLATAVKLEVEAIDNYNIYNGSEQTYGLDMAAPVVWAMAPIGAPIDNDGDGLFNEDAPNGVNEDLDWVDLNHNGFWDAGEPQIVDEDPIDFMPAVIPQGTNVVVALGFEDYSGLQYLIPGTTDWYYTGQSGINAASVAVTLNGSTITGTITNGTFTHNAGVLEAGHYTVVASVPDVVGNVGSLAFEFNVVGGAPSITINALGDGNYWLNSVSNNTLTFTVESEVQLANGGVVANVYTVPANVLLQGPMTLNAVAGIYSVNILGGLIPANQTGIRLEVIATDVWGGSSTANQVFGIDNNAPVINLTSPVENAQFVMNATVNIMATITDQTTERVAGIRSSQFNTTKDRSGSGIDNVTLTVIAPDGTNAFEPIIYPENTQVIMKSMPAAQYGTYIINLSAKDGAGNQSVVTRNFIVTPATGPTVTFNEIANGWLNSVGMNNLGFTVNSPVSVTVAANVYTYPSEALLMGPLNVNPVSGLYTVALNGGMIPADQTSVRLQVMVTDQFGNVTEANNYYSVDKIAPTITILTPANGAEITLVDEATKVRIDAQFSDTVAMLKATSGSGIAMSKLIVIDPLGAQVGAAIETGAGITETTHEISNLMLGTYTVRVTVWDNAGNQAMASVNFTVVAIPAPPANLEISEAHAYPNPMDAGLGARFSISLTSAATVNVRIYDFAGREVRSMDYAGRVEGKSTIEIVFDGRNNNGEKLARGTYFARVIANDGKKIVEKVVKIAIKK